MNIRQATTADFTELVEMFKDLIKTVYHSNQLKDDIFFHGAVMDWFRSGKDIVIAEKDDEIAGFTLAYIQDLGYINPYYYGDIAYIKPHFRKTRAAYLLYNNVVNYAKQLGLEVEARAFVGNGNKNSVDKIQSKFGTPEFIHFKTNHIKEQ
ncbi:N-acetyltransferase family protein [Sulfurimonas sp.]|uniref:GNAT family N-acetyltransferase n=1 Tax=Sulfurimonas sp. TaxID=2022749 RepID=UPI0035693D17